MTNYYKKTNGNFGKTSAKLVRGQKPISESAYNKLVSADNAANDKVNAEEAKAKAGK